MDIFLLTEHFKSIRQAGCRTADPKFHSNSKILISEQLTRSKQFPGKCMLNT